MNIIARLVLFIGFIIAIIPELSNSDINTLNGLIGIVPSIWQFVAILVVSVAISIALAPTPPNARPASLSEFTVPTAQEGRPIPVIFGTVTVQSPNVVWYGDLAYQQVVSSGGK